MKTTQLIVSGREITETEHNGNEIWAVRLTWSDGQKEASILGDTAMDCREALERNTGGKIQQVKRNGVFEGA